MITARFALEDCASLFARVKLKTNSRDMSSAIQKIELLICLRCMKHNQHKTNKHTPTKQRQTAKIRQKWEWIWMNLNPNKIFAETTSIYFFRYKRHFAKCSSTSSLSSALTQKQFLSFLRLSQNGSIGLFLLRCSVHTGRREESCTIFIKW